MITDPTDPRYVESEMFDGPWSCPRCGEDQTEGPGALCLPCVDDDQDGDE